ncbi:YhcN/YlaJ family sporulation lipoprotein [Peribacillus acanthi]|uniref:YhcN/YlaJ family sporulation lipoprotein n=1 Tax=Peribacillus acanthi TaxID=2171554 RepID=UPI000D3E8E2F|nr:YhcN/YlaJ family sporulation lipoprotein [Peribacillus acanthi]
MKHRLLILLTLMILGGCQMTKENAQEEKNKAEEKVMNVKNSVIENVDTKTGKEISKRLVSLASKTPYVNDATAVVVGPYAIVGIDIDAEIERSQVGSIKYSVAEAIKHDPYGANAIVIADPDTKARVDEVAKDIENGRPIQGIMNELADIAGRLMPEIPGDLVDPVPYKATEEPKDALNKKDKQLLDKEQQDQSNNYKD